MPCGHVEHIIALAVNRMIVMFNVSIYIVCLLLASAAAAADMDFRKLIAQASERLAENAGAKLDHLKLAGGICISTEDGGHSSGCQEQGEGTGIC